MAREIVAADWDQQVLRSPIPVAVEFWAPWCPWCRRLTPEFEALSVEYENRLSMVRLNSDAHPELAIKYGVMGLPTIKFFCKGRIVGELVGYVPGNRLKNEFERMLQNNRECLSSSSPML